MTFSRSGYDTQIQLSSEELFEISQEITHRFAPKPPKLSSGLISDRSDSSSQLTAAKHQVYPFLYSSKHSPTQISSLELLEISQEINRKFAPNPLTGAPELVLLPVDPYHLHAYWTIGQEEHFTTQTDQSLAPMILRIYWRPDENAMITTAKIWFDVELNHSRTSQKIRVPVDGTAYSAVIGRLLPDNNLQAYTHSNIIHVPYDKLKAPPIPGRKLPPVTKTLPHTPLQSFAQTATEALHYETASLDAGTTGIWYDKNLHQSLNPDEKQFFSKMRIMLYEQNKLHEQNKLYEQNSHKKSMLTTNVLATSYSLNKKPSAQGR